MLLLHAKRHWPHYVTTMMWPFALKEEAYRLNRLSLRSDGRSCKATFFNVDMIYLTLQGFMSLVHLDLFWICDCNLVLLVLRNGNQDCVWAFTWVIPPCMLDQLLWFSILGQGTFLFNSTCYLMISFPLLLI